MGLRMSTSDQLLLLMLRSFNLYYLSSFKVNLATDPNGHPEAERPHNLRLATSDKKGGTQRTVRAHPRSAHSLSAVAWREGSCDLRTLRGRTQVGSRYTKPTHHVDRLRRQSGFADALARRKENIEDSSTLSVPSVTPDANRTSVFLNDSTTDPEAESGSVLSFRSEERFEHSFAIFWSNARTSICDHNA